MLWPPAPDSGGTPALAGLVRAMASNSHRDRTSPSARSLCAPSQVVVPDEVDRLAPDGAREADIVDFVVRAPTQARRPERAAEWAAKCTAVPSVMLLTPSLLRYSLPSRGACSSPGQTTVAGHLPTELGRLTALEDMWVAHCPPRLPALPLPKHALPNHRPPPHTATICAMALVLTCCHLLLRRAWGSLYSGTIPTELALMTSTTNLYAAFAGGDGVAASGQRAH